MARLSRAQMDAPILDDDTALTADVLQHLDEVRPDLARRYPAGYFIALVRHSARLARDRFGLRSLPAVRTFVQLRWDIAPGFYHHPTVAAVLSDAGLAPEARFETLLSEPYEHVWLEAAALDGPAYWRGSKSDGFGDLDEIADEIGLGE